MPIEADVPKRPGSVRLEVDVWCSVPVARMMPAVLADDLKGVALGMLKALGIRNASLSIALLSGSSMRRLNRSYLGHDYVTDVVTFDLHADAGSPVPGKRRSAAFVASGRDVWRARVDLCGEICICPAEVKRNAKIYQEPFERELRRYLAHGILHLLGFDDRTEGLRSVMRKEEDRLLDLVSSINSQGRPDSRTAGSKRR